MNSFDSKNPQIDIKNPWMSVLFLFFFFLIGNFVAQLIATGVTMVLFGMGINDLANITSPPFSEETKQHVMILQGLSHFLGFTVIGLLFIKLVDQTDPRSYFHLKSFKPGRIGYIILITFAFMLFNSLVIEWNMNITFPDALQSFGEWAREMEDSLMELTMALTKFDTFGQMLVGLLVIAILPGIGEELIFRGLLQNKLYKASGSIHGAIWVTAIIFGVFHLQFFGVFPRILLGALFGYIYYFSGNIWYPIIAHFLNNGIAVVMMYYGPKMIEDFDPQTVESEIPLAFSLVGLLVCIILFYMFKKDIDSETA